MIPSAQAGDIEGFIIDANTGRYLPGVEIEVVGESRSATASMEIGLEVFELAAFRVEGYREGRALALQQKRTANNLMDIISADSVGSLPDRNVAEALARIPGINLDVDAGEGRFVSIRGLDQILTM